MSRGIEDAILPACRELGIAITAYGVLSRGLISGNWTRDRDAAPRATSARSRPRFQGAALDHNLALVDALAAVAAERGATVAQMAIAWVLSRGEDIVPLVGARTRERLAEALGALDIALSADDVAAIERAVPAGAAAGIALSGAGDGGPRQRVASRPRVGCYPSPSPCAVRAVSSAVEHLLYTQVAGGSNPSPPTSVLSPWCASLGV